MTALQVAIQDMRNSGEWTSILWQDSNLKSSVEYTCTHIRKQNKYEIKYKRI